MSTSAEVPAPDWLDVEPGETVWLHASPSKSLVLVGVGIGFVVLVGVSALVGALGDVLIGRALSAVMLVSLLLLLIGPFLLSERREYVLTNSRVIEKPALPWRSDTWIPIENVEAVSLEQSSWEGYMGIGDLRFDTVHNAHDLRFAYLDDPHLVFEKVSERLDRR